MCRVSAAAWQGCGRCHECRAHVTPAMQGKVVEGVMNAGRYYGVTQGFGTLVRLAYDMG
jgi:hypothetical protein